MQPLVIVAVAVLRLGHEEDRAIRSKVAINHRRRRNPHLRGKFAAALVVSRRLARFQSGCLPQLHSGVRIQGVQRVVFRCEIQHVVDDCVPIVSSDTNNGWASTAPSVGKMPNFRNLAELTFVGVRCVSLAYSPVRAMSLCHVVTSSGLFAEAAIVKFRSAVPLTEFTCPRKVTVEVAGCRRNGGSQCKGLRNTRRQCRGGRAHRHARRQILHRHIRLSPYSHPSP